MGTPITTWPGAMPGTGETPFSASMAMFGRIPMFSGDPGPRYTGPFNANMGQYGGVLQMMMPSLLQMLMGNEHMPAQFFPEQNLYDQIQAMKFQESSQQAMQFASRRDTGTIESMMGGVTQMMTGQPLTDLQKARNYRVASGVSQFMPMLTQILGPDLIDQLHGSRGSATVFAQQLHHALRTSMDPVHGLPGYSGESAGRVTQETFERLFGQGADPGILKGMSAGQAGMFLHELQARGMMGRPLGMLSLDERRSALPTELSSDTINRLAERLPDIKQIVDAGGHPTEEMLQHARDTIKKSHQQLKDKTVKMDEGDLEKMPGGQDIIRSGDADRIVQRLKNLSGAVKAMRDIFGDMGNPNAPMREIINGLEALTQGGIATMSPADLEMMVRKTHTIAKQTGVGVEGLMAMTAQNAGLADKLGLDRSFAITSAQQAATFGAAAGDNLRLDIPVWGALTKEQMTLGDQQLRMHAAASPLANQLNAVLRMSETGMATPAANTQLAAFTNAIRNGQMTYEFDGKKHDVIMPHAQMVEMMKRDAGVSPTQTYSVLQDISGNQEFGQKFNTPNLVRRIQTDETARRMLTPVLGNRIRGAMTDEGLNSLMEAQGITKDEGDFRRMMDTIGEGVGQDFLNLDPAVVRSPERKQEAMGQSFRKRLRSAIAARMPGAKDDEIDAITENMVNQMGGDQGLNRMGTTITASINDAARSHPLFKSDVGMHNMLHQGTLNQANSRERAAEITAITQQAMAGLGTSDPIRRLSDAFQNAKPNESLQDMLSTVMGGVSMDSIKAADPEGGLAKIFGLVKENQALDPTNPMQLERARRNADIMKGIIEGGDTAVEQLRRMDASREKITPDKADDAQKTSAIQRLDDEHKKEITLRDAKVKNEQTRLTESTDRIAKLEAGTVDADKIATETQRATGHVRTMAAQLGNQEIDLGGNRFLTSKGIVTKNDKGETVSTAGFNKMEVVKESLDVFQKRHDQAVATNQQADTAYNAMTPEQKAQAASDRGFLRGGLSYGNEEIYKQLQRASKRDSNSSLLGDLGYQLGANVSREQVSATVDMGNLAKKLMDEGKITEESKSAANTFVLGSKERGRQLLEDERSMNIIGRGGLDLIQGAMEQSSKIQQLAQDESKRLGREVSVGELLQGGEGISVDIRQQAVKLFDQARTRWGEIKKLRDIGMVPGKGDDPVNRNRAGMTDLERKDLADQQKFSKEFSTPEARAAAALDQMIGMTATKDQKARLNVDTNRQMLIKAIAEGDRGVALHRAGRSRDEILEMGIKKGIFGKKTKLTDLTDEEITTATDKLDALQLSDDEKSDLQRLKRDAGPLMDFGLKGMRPEDLAPDVLRRVQQAQIQQAQPTDTQDKKLDVKVTGNVRITENGMADLSLDGRGVMDQVNNVLGMA